MRFFTGHGERAVNVLVAVLLVASLAGPFVTTAAAVPSGMVTIPDANVSEDVPVGSDPVINASRLEGNVMASDHAESLRVIVTTPDRASDYLDNGSAAGSSGSLTLVLSDDQNSDGRRVAIGAEAVRDALGYTPERVYGTHEDGTKWSRAVEYEGGMLVFEVPHFSSNSITFSGEVSLSGTYTDGSTVNYDVDSLDSVSDFSLNVTGASASEWDNDTHSRSSSGVVDPQIAGNVDPLGPSGGDPKLVVSGSQRTEQFPGSFTNTATTSKTFGVVKTVAVHIQATEAGTGDGSSRDIGFEIREASSGTVLKSGSITLVDDSEYNDQEVESYTINQQVDDQVTIDLTTNRAHADIKADGNNVISAYPDVAVTANGTTYDFGTVDSQQSKRIDVSPGDTLDYSFNSGLIDSEFQIKERTQTVDPTVEVNGQTTSYSGTLSDGSTASLSANNSWIESGTNAVDISVGDGSLSGDAPTPSVALNYTHSASDKQSVNYSANKWSESYNVSKTFASDRSSASLTIPFAGDVAGIENIETRVNGGTWNSVPQDSYTLNNTTLTADLGSVNGGDTVEVRTTGRRVNVVNGAITVVEPTVKGERLDSKVRLDSWSTNSHLSVGATPDARRVHYVYKESWSNADTYSKITGDGYNLLYMPGASAGDEARVSTIPVSVNAKSGEVRLSVDDPRTQEPQFQVRPGSTDGDTVEFTYLDAADSTHYVLKSKTNDVVLDDGTANSPLTLEDDDSAETLVFLKDPISGDSGVVGPVDVGGDSGDPLSSPTVVVIAWGLLTAGFYVLQRRVGGPSGLRIPFVGAVPFPGGLITAVGSVGSGLLIIEFYSGRVSSALASVIESVGPIAGIAGVGIVVWWAYNQFRGRPVVIDQ